MLRGFICCVNTDTVFIAPVDTLSFDPLANLDFSLAVGEYTSSVLLAALPWAFVAATIWPSQSSFTFLLVLDVLANIVASVGPGKFAGAMHLVVLPSAIVASIVAPLVLARPADVVVLEFTDVARVVCPGELPRSVLCSIDEITIVL